MRSFKGNRKLGSSRFAAAFAQVSFTLYQSQTRCQPALVSLTLEAQDMFEY